MKLSDFYNKKILVVVPHQDDEINLAGTLILSLAKKADVFILYATEGNFLFSSKIRKNEAIRACKKLGVDDGHVLFLQYPDQPYDQDTHMYNKKTNWKDKNGKNFNLNDLVCDIQNKIEILLPEVILCVDLDFHPDHIMTSLCTEKAIGNILSKKGDYHPTVLKGFTYENAYHGPADYNDVVEKGMYIDYDRHGVSRRNVYYNRKNAIRIMPDENAISRNLQKNGVYRAIKEHKSQVLVERAFRIINPDLVFWKRNTDNLIFEANVDVSSGEKEYLMDFLINDTSNVLNGDKREIVYDESIWIPEKTDVRKNINISFDKMQKVGKILIYHGNNRKKDLENINIVVNGKRYIPEKKDRVSVLCFADGIDTINVNIQAISENPENGFSEIEILPPEPQNMDRIVYIENKSRNLSSAQRLINRVINEADIIAAKAYRKVFMKRVDR